MADVPVKVTTNDAGDVVIAATCSSCGARHVVTIANVGAFTRQTVLTILGNARPAGAGAGLAIASSCGRCLENDALADRHAERFR